MKMRFFGFPFLLLFSSLAWGECEPQQVAGAVDLAQRSCLAQLCQNTHTIPTTQSELDAKWREFGLTVPTQVLRARANAQAAAAEHRRLVQTATPAGIFNELTANPTEVMPLFLKTMRYVVAMDSQVHDGPTKPPVFNDMIGLTEADRTSLTRLQQVVNQWDFLAVIGLMGAEGYTANNQDKQNWVFYYWDLFNSLRRAAGSDAAAVARLNDYQAKLSSSPIRIDRRRMESEVMPFLRQQYAGVVRGLAEPAQLVLGKAIDILRSAAESNSERIFSCEIQALYKLQAEQLQRRGVFDRWTEQTLAEMRTSFIPLLSAHSGAELSAQVERARFTLSTPQVREVDTRKVKVGNSTLANIHLSSLRSAPCDFNDTLFDHAEENKIVISAMAMSYGLRGILSHETGHLVLQLMYELNMSVESLEKLRRLLSCIQSMHPDPSGRYVGEDFADWYLAKTNPGGIGVPCFLAELMGVDRELYDSDPSDSHSNSLFRQIHTTMVAGREVPEACNTLMNTKKERPVRCEL